ncbi:Pentatricopeptide repeat-containing protein [Orobanche gracilis]
MTLCRLLLRSIRRYSSSSNLYPFHSSFPTSTAQTPDYPPQNPQHNPTHPPLNPPNPYTSTLNQFYSPRPSDNAASDASNYHHSPHVPASTPESSNYYQSPQFSSTTANGSNYHHNPHVPASTPGSSNYYQSQFPASVTPNGLNYQYSPRTPAASDALNSQHNPQINTPESNYYQNLHFPASANASSYQYNPQTPVNEASNYNNSEFSTASATTDFQFPDSAASSYPQRSYSFSSAEEAAAERRRRKRRLRIEPPLYALSRNPPTNPPNPRDPNKPRPPDSTNVLTGPRLNLHNRVQSLIRAGDLDYASYVARQSVFQSTRAVVFTCNAIIAAMYRAKRYNDAKALFQYFMRQFNVVPNIVSYNNLIVSHCEMGEVDEALEVYKYILENSSQSPSAITYRHLTKGLIDVGRIDDAVSLLHEMLNKGLGADSLVFNNVILGFLNLGNFEKANELFDELKERCAYYDGVINATFMDWFFNQGKPKEAMESYRELMARNYRMVPPTRNALLETLLKHGKKKEAWDLFQDMLDDHTPPTFQAVNSDTINMMVNECFKEGNVEEAIDVFKRSGTAAKSRPFQMDVAGFNNMMLRLCELEMMDEAEKYYKQLCDKSLSPDVNTYKILIDTYIKLDRVDNMLMKYSKMVEVGLRVIPPYANKWFEFLIRKGRATDCLPILSKMADREPKPDVTTYDIVIRGLVGEGNFDATVNLLREMTNHGVGTTASLREFVLGVFEGLGRRPEIENIINRSLNPFPPQRSYPEPRGPQRRIDEGGRNPAMPFQTASSYQFTEHAHQPQMKGQMAHPHSTPEQEAEFTRVAGQIAV